MPSCINLKFLEDNGQTCFRWECQELKAGDWVGISRGQERPLLARARAAPRAFRAPAPLSQKIGNRPQAGGVNSVLLECTGCIQAGLQLFGLSK